MRGIRNALLLLTALGLASSSTWAAPRKAKSVVAKREAVTTPSSSSESNDDSTTRSNRPSPTPSPTPPASSNKAEAGDAVDLGLPTGVSLSKKYVTRIRGDYVESQAEQLPQRQPDVVVHAVRVDADGNRIEESGVSNRSAGPAQTATTETTELTVPEPALPEKPASEKSDSDGGFFGFLFGSDDDDESASEAKQTPEEQPLPFPDLSPASRNVRIGKLVSVDENGRFGVLWLDSRYLAFFGNELVLSRADDLSISGTLRLTSLRNGKAVGLERASGHPTTGDEIILPGPQYTAYINELYQSGQIVPTSTSRPGLPRE